MTNESKATQCNDIIRYCKIHGSITTRQAMRELEIMRLASRIHDLKKAGYEIEDNWLHINGKKYKQYRIVGRKVA